jgi:putative PIN family toxin of toxin-antitoxin system
VIRAVLDTNVLISAILVPSGIPARILMAAFATVFSCFASEAIVGEVLTALGRGRVQRKYQLDPAFVSRVRVFPESRPVLVPVTDSVSGVATHPEDDLILATVLSARADYLVTGDRQLLALQSFQGVQIVSPRQFLAILGLPESAP